jgi:YVTN family beta-propeller protein
LALGLLAAALCLCGCSGDEDEGRPPRPAGPGAPVTVAGVGLYPIPEAVAEVCRSAQTASRAPVLCPTHLPRPLRDLAGSSALPPPVLTAFRWEPGGVDFSYSGETGRPRLDRPERFFHLQVIRQHDRLPPGARPAEVGGRGGLLARATSLEYGAESYFANHWRFFWSDDGDDYAATLHHFGPRTEPLLDWFVRDLRPARALPRRVAGRDIHTIDVPVPGPVSLAAQGDAIWVAGQGDRVVSGAWLARIDARSGQVTGARIKISSGGTPALAAGESLLVAQRGAQGLQHLADGRLESTHVAPPSIVAVAQVGGSLWLVEYGEPPGRGSVLKLSKHAERVVAEGPVGRAPAAMAAGAGSLWVTANLDDALTRVDLETGRVAGTIEVGDGPVGVATAGGDVWVANTEEATVSRIDPELERVVDTIEVGRGPRAVAAGAGSIWVTNSLDDTVSRIDPETGRVTETIRVGAGPTAVAIAAGAVWVANNHDQTVSRIEP